MALKCLIRGKRAKVGSNALPVDSLPVTGPNLEWGEKHANYEGKKSLNCRTRRRAATSATSKEIPPFRGMFQHRLLHRVREVASLTQMHCK